MSKLSFRVPLYPSFAKGTTDIPGRIGQHIPNVFDGGRTAWTLNARSGLQIGLQSMNLQPGDEVLVPAYHCPVLIFPIVQQGLKPIFYCINKDCSTDINDLRSRVTERTRAIIVIHFFGYPTKLQDIKTLCQAHNAYLIEDCAHAFFGDWQEQRIGAEADISIASIYKFFPTVDGGGVRFNNEQLWRNSRKQPRTGLFKQLKSLLNTLETRANPDHASFLLKILLNFKEVLWKLWKKPSKQTPHNKQSTTPDERENDPDSPYTADQIAPTCSPIRMPIFARWFFRFTSQEKVATRRKKNYLALHRALSDLGHTPLFGELPAGVVPYNLPIVTEHADELADRLRKHGIAVGRFAEYYWDERDRGICSTADYLSKHCIQIPIHQSVSPKNLQTISRVLGKADEE